MREEMYEQLKSKIPDFDAKYTQRLPLSNIELDRHNSQVRKNGHVFAKVGSMVASLQSSARQKTPITVRMKANGNGELKDGITRFLAKERMAEPDIWVSIYHDSLNLTSDEWFDFQCSANDHPPSTENTEDDIEAQISERVHNGAIERSVGFKYAVDPAKYIADAVAYLEPIYPNAGWSTLKFRNCLAKCLVSVAGTTWQNYNKSEAMKFIANQNPLGWTTTKKPLHTAGDITNNVCFYACGTKLNVRKDAFANAGYKKIDNPNANIYLVYWVKDLVGKDDAKMMTERQSAVALYDKINGTYNIFAGMFFLPQFKSGPNQENLYKMIQVR